MAKTNKYVITRKGVNIGLGDDKIEHKIGDEVSLTDEKALALSGKVQLKSDAGRQSKTSRELTAENVKLVKQIDALTAENATQDETIKSLTEQLAAK